MSFLERALKAMRVKCVCKSCIREHSDKHVLRSQSKFTKSDLRKYTASSLLAPYTE